MSAAIDSQGVLETLEHADRLLIQQVSQVLIDFLVREFLLVVL